MNIYAHLDTTAKYVSAGVMSQALNLLELLAEKLKTAAKPT